MRSLRQVALLCWTILLVLASGAHAYTWCGGWGGSNVLMNVYPIPTATFDPPAQAQLAEWNRVQGDTSRPFRVVTNPVDVILFNDRVNSVAFLNEANLQARFGLSWDGVLAWAVSLPGSATSCAYFVESDVIFNSQLPWNTNPDPAYWFQSTAIHEFGHVLGLKHYNGAMSVMNSGVDKLLRGETLYMDDKEGFRDIYDAFYVLPSETDIAVYPKYHDATTEPHWMTLSNTSVTAGQSVTLQNLTVENPGLNALGHVRLGFYLSTNSTISTSDTFLGYLFWNSYARFTRSKLSHTVQIPAGTGSGTYYLGAIMDYNGGYSESNESNNYMLAVNGTSSPAPISITGSAPIVPSLSPIPSAVIAGSSKVLTGSGFTAGSVVLAFVATSSGAQSHGPYTPSSWSPTSLTWSVPSSLPLGNGFVTLLIVNTDQGYTQSGTQSQNLVGNASQNIPTILSVNGTSLAPLDPSIPTANVETVVAAGSTITIGGSGFNNPLVNLFTANGNVGPLAPISWNSNSFQVAIPAFTVTGPGAFQVVNSPYVGNVVSNAVSVPIGSQLDITSISQVGSTVIVNGAGFSSLTVINFFNVAGGFVVNFGGLDGGGNSKIPLTVNSSNQFTFQKPAGSESGPAYVMALNPPFIPFTSTTGDANGAFTLSVP